eukprot:g1174.t1
MMSQSSNSSSKVKDDAATDASWRLKAPNTIKIPRAKHVKQQMSEEGTSAVMGNIAISGASSSLVHLAALSIAKNRVRTMEESQIRGSGRFVLKPGTRLLFWWDTVVLASVMFTLVYAPLQIVLEKPYGDEGSGTFYLRFLIDRFVDCVFLLDVFAHFRTATTNIDGTLSFDAKTIASKYLNGWFAFDLVIAFPWDLIILAADNGDLEEGNTGADLLKRTPRLLKLFRLSRVLNITKRWESHIHMTYRTVNALTIFATFLLEKYSIAVYWSLTTLTTIGYGDVLPVLGNNVELWFNVFVMMLGAAVYAFVVGKVSEYVSSKHAAREHFESRVSHLKSYMKKHEVPVELRDRIEKYCRFIRNAEKIKFKMDGLSLLSPALRQELSLCIHIDSLSTSIAFNAGVCTAVIAEAATLLTPLLYGPDEAVACAGETCSSMYFVSDGKLLTESTRGRVGYLDGGTSFGDRNVVFASASQRETVLTLTFSNLMALSNEDMMTVWAKYPMCWAYAKSDLTCALWHDILTSGALTSYAGLGQHALSRNDEKKKSSTC